MLCSQRDETTHLNSMNPNIDLCIYKSGKMSRQMNNINYYYTSEELSYVKLLLINELFKSLPHKINY